MVYGRLFDCKAGTCELTCAALNGNMDRAARHATPSAMRGAAPKCRLFCTALLCTALLGAEQLNLVIYHRT